MSATSAMVPAPVVTPSRETPIEWAESAVTCTRPSATSGAAKNDGTTHAIQYIGTWRPMMTTTSAMMAERQMVVRASAVARRASQPARAATRIGTAATSAIAYTAVTTRALCACSVTKTFGGPTVITLLALG